MAHIITDAEAQSLVKIANSIIGPLVNKGLIKKNDMPDAVQGLLMEAVRLSQSYDENTNAQFSTYAHGVMNVQVFRIIRKQYSATNRILSEAISLDEILDAEDSDDAPDYNRIGIMPGSLIGDEQEANRQELFACIQEVIRTLPEEQQEVCRLLMDGICISKIARIMKCSRPTIRAKMKSIRNAFILSGISPQTGNK